MTKHCDYTTFLSLAEPGTIKYDLLDYDWIVAMLEELKEFEIKKSLESSSQAKGTYYCWKLLGFFWNKVDDAGPVIRNKPRLVVKGYSQLEGIDYDEI